jgi:hypothetical protein
MKLKINSVNELGTFEEVIEGSSENVQRISKKLRALVAEVLPGVTEVPWNRQGMAGYGVGPKKMSEHFCYIAPQKNHVNLGFYYGADLPDPNGLLEGTGKLLRHVKIRDEKETGSRAVLKLLKEASTYLPRLNQMRAE